MDFWLNIYKPRGISSANAVAIVKKNLRGAKVGHCGTLDVEAEGVLPLAIGEATKLVRLLVDARKTYIFTIQFGNQTDSADYSGKIINTTSHIPSKHEAYQICSKFTGIVEQTPPSFSALKINGVRAYKLARAEQFVEIKPRNIEIYSLECLDFNPSLKQATYQVECSKGTYVRTLGEDIALSLQSLAFVVELRRTQVGLFKASEAINITELENLEQGEIIKLLEQRSVKVETILDDILVLDATEEQAKKIIFGQECYFNYNQNISLLWVRYKNTLLAIGALSENCFKSFRVFNLINKEITDVDNSAA